MRKLSLKNLNFGENDLLNRQELKTVLGGYTAAQCVDINACWNWADYAFDQIDYYNYASTSAYEANQGWTGLYEYCLGVM